MDSFKKRGTPDARKGMLSESGPNTPQGIRPKAEDLFFHFSAAMQSFQPVAFRRVEAWSGPAPELPNERILRLDGPHPFVSVVRTQDRLETVLSNPAAPTPGLFDRLVLELGKGLARQVLASTSIGKDSLFVRPSTPRYWPTREPEAIGRIWVGATPLEIRFWMI